jgi:hypothetical protein
LAIIVKKLLNIFAALPNCQSTGGVSIEMAKPIEDMDLFVTVNVATFKNNGPYHDTFTKFNHNEFMSFWQVRIA